MSVEIKVPTLGESIVEAGILRWLKQEGDAVAEGEAVVELETDKTNVEVYAEKGGVLERIARREGDSVAINEVLGSIATNGSAAATAPAPKADAAPVTQTVAPAPAPVVEAKPAPNGNGAAAPTVEASPPTPNTNPAARATPVAVKMADDAGLDLGGVQGSGPGGKITIEDVKAALSVRPSAPQTGVGAQFIAPSSAPPPTPNVQRPTPTTREEVRPMSRRRQAIARNLVEAQHTAAMLTTFNEVDMGAVMDLRKRRNPDYEKRHGVKIGFMSFFTKAVVGALKAFPLLNAEIRGTDIIVKSYYDIGVAVSTDDGLVVPVVRGADALTFAGIEKAIGELAGKARGNSLKIEEMQGGTFTITNGGIFGSLMSTPILNPPQVGILGMHKIQDRPMVVNGEVVVRPMMYLALSYDHRIVDGAEAVRFLVRVKELIEDPEALLLEG